jgi:UDP-glucose 4-epimerase
MSSSKAVLITGASGFIGGYTAKHFGQSGWQIVALDRKDKGIANPPRPDHFDHYVQDDLTNPIVTLTHLERYQPQLCVHLAGPASPSASFQQPVSDFVNQTVPLLHLLEAIRISRLPTHVLLVSSAAVYGNPESLPVSEDAKTGPISPYGFHKYHQEMILDQYRTLYGLSVCKARVFSTYGAGLTHLAVWDITRRATRGDYTIFGSGEESRDYLHVEDVAAALCCMSAQAPFAGEAINVASGRETKITHLAETIYKVLGVGGRPELIGCNGDGNNRAPLRWHADITRLRTLGFEPSIDLESGLSSTVEWIKSNE